MKHTNSNIVLKEYSAKIQAQAKANLKKSSQTGNLESDLIVDYKPSKTGFYITISMEDYGEFLDLGVKGREPKLVKNGRQKAPNSPNSFKSKMPPLQPIQAWAKARNIRLRNEKGQYAKGDYKTIGFIIQKRIFAQGIKPTYFITEPLEDLIQEFTEKYTEAYAADIIDYLFE